MSRRLKAARGDLLGVGLVLVAAALYLSPAIKDGFSFGPFDLGELLTIGHSVPLTIHDRLNGDLITQMVPWNVLSWRAVHHGQLPLWNTYSLLGTPLMFNFESAVASLPDLVGYLFPLSSSFFAAVTVKLVLAGTGTYLFCRVLGARPVPAAFGGITFMLSGAFVNWLGWPLSDVVAWTGFLCAFSMLAYRRRAARYVVLLAVSAAFCCYGGFPEAYVLLALTLGAGAAVLAVAKWAMGERLSAGGIARVVGGGAAGLGLAAPLLLPGAQLLAGSQRSAVGAHVVTQPASYLDGLISQGYLGLPLHGSVWFGGSDYFESVVYVGLIALVLAAVGVVACWRRPVVLAVVAVGASSLLLGYHLGGLDVGAFLLNRVGLGDVEITRVRIVAGFAAAVLAALGLDRLLARPTPAVRATFALASAVGALCVLGLVVGSVSQHLSAVDGAERLRSLLWPVATAVGLLVAAAAVLVVGRRNRPWRPRWRRGLAVGLVGAQGAFLVFAGVGVNSYDSAFTVVNPSLQLLRATVGTGLLGLDGAVVGTPRVWDLLGIYPNLNAAFSLAEFAGHDPALPAGYFSAFASPPSFRSSRSSVLVPDIDSVAEARAYGISYLLVARARPLPTGSVPVVKLAGQWLVRVPGSARFSFAPGSGATVSSWSQPSNRSFRLQVRAPRAARLLLAVTDVPGWHVSADGRPLAVARANGVMMAVEVPAGTRLVTMSYLPERFVDGVAVALVSLVALVGYAVLTWRRRPPGRHARRSGAAD